MMSRPLLAALALLVIAPACGRKKSPPANQPPPADVPAAPGGGEHGAPPPCAAGELRGERGCAKVPGFPRADALTSAGARLDGIAAVLRDAQVVADAGDVIAQLHASPSWRKRAAARRDFTIVDLATPLRDAPAKLGNVARDIAYAAGEVRAMRDQLAAIARAPGVRTLTEVRAAVSNQVTATFAPRGEAVTAMIRDVISPLVSPLVDEIVLARDEVCVRPDPSTRAPCERLDTLLAASAYLERARATARQDFDAAGGDVAGELAPWLDDVGKAALDGATGRGPSHGQPCGPADVCARDLTCRHVGGAPGTCERSCSEVAKQPCPAGLVCRTLADLGPVCRP